MIRLWLLLQILRCGLLTTCQSIIWPPNERPLAVSYSAWHNSMQTCSSSASAKASCPPRLAFAMMQLIDEMRDTVGKEFDFVREARLMRVIAERLSLDGLKIRIPQPVTELISPQLLVMERMPGWDRQIILSIRIRVWCKLGFNQCCALPASELELCWCTPITHTRAGAHCNARLCVD